MHSDRFFAFARARHEITLARASGAPRPWSDDPILQMYRFTNIFRELDRTTVWIRKNVREPVEHKSMTPVQQIMSMVLARTFNRTETLEQIFCQERLIPRIDPCAWAYLRGECTIDEIEMYMRAYCRKPWVTGAYIVKTPDGMDKLAGALWIVEQARLRLEALVGDRSFAKSMESLHADLVRMPYLGGFTAYEIVTDLRHMPIGRDWPDIMTWANAGPGAIRGLHRIHGRDYTRGMSQRQALSEMLSLLWASNLEHNWPREWPRWEMREVEHTLCEFDKYERVRLGQGTPRGRFR